MQASRLLIVCLSNYSAWSGLLAGLPPGALSGRLIVQLSTGAPDEAVRLVELQAGLGGRSLDGAILAFPEAVGTDRCIIYLGGPTAEFVTAEVVLGALGVLQHLDEAIEAPNALDAALLIYTFGARIAFLQAAALFETTGAPLGLLVELSQGVGKGLDPWTREVTSAVIRQAYDGDQATVQTFHGVWSMARAYGERQGLPVGLLAAFEALSASALRQGFGEAEFPALMEALRRP